MKVKLLIIAILVSTAGLCLGTSSAKGTIQVKNSGEQVKVRVSVSHPGKGNLNLKLNSNGELMAKIDVKYTTFDEGYAWIAGKCTAGRNALQGKWFFAAINDGGKPGELVDYIWWEWLSPDAESTAKQKVENLEITGSNKPVQDGNITIE